MPATGNGDGKDAVRLKGRTRQIRRIGRNADNDPLPVPLPECLGYNGLNKHAAAGFTRLLGQNMQNTSR